MENFYNSLYLALLYYRSAQFTYNLLLSLRQKDSSNDKSSDDLNCACDICEEMRVSILRSLRVPVFPINDSLPDFTDLQQFGAWLTYLGHKDRDSAEKIIRDSHMQLLYPRFIEDIALGLLYLQNSDSFERGRRKLDKVAALLEANRVGGELNYLTGLYMSIASALEQAGQPDEALLYRQKAEESMKPLSIPPL